MSLAVYLLGLTIFPVTVLPNFGVHVLCNSSCRGVMLF